MTIRIAPSLAVLAGLWAAGQAQEPLGYNRAVLDEERGFCFGYARNWAEAGAYVGLPQNGFFAQMRPEAIKAPHGRFQHFTPLDDGALAYFPYGELKAWETRELAAGRQPFFVTADYQGRKRPVIFAWSAGSEFGEMEAVNFRDERYIEFWIQRYVREILWPERAPNLWVGVDNGAWDYSLYGVLDDRGRFVPGVRWDAGFPQNQNEFLEALKHFLRRVKELAPDIRIILNGMHLPDAGRFAELWNDVDGIILEDFMGGDESTEYGPDNWQRERFFDTFSRAGWAGAEGKVAVFQFRMAPAAPPQRLRTGYLAYLIFRGENSFFGPLYAHDNFEVPLEEYAALKDSLGAPVSEAIHSQAPGERSFGRRLYWRRCEGGIAYLNWTGQEQRVELPKDRLYYSRDGDRVPAITIPDRQGEYALTRPEPRAAKPSINPRGTGLVNGPLTVTLSTSTPGARVHYTLDGSEPASSSPLYLRPLILEQSATVKARSFRDGLLDSFVSAARYTITGEPPQAGFHLSEFQGSPAMGRHHPLLKLSHASALPVSVDFSVRQGSLGPELAGGTAWFRPGDSYTYFLANAGTGCFQITLANPVNATLDERRVFFYDNRPVKTSADCKE